MEQLNVEYIGSYPSEKKCPQAKYPEFAFIGRSNVGKSSLINMLCGRKNIARVSNTPGKTQLLNFFKVNQDWYLVDLPGYGYAKVSKKLRGKWQGMIGEYLKNRSSLSCTFVLLDSRHPLQDIDLEFINWLGENAIAFVIVYTKTDKLKPNDIEKNIAIIREELLQYWEELPQQFITSAKTKEGKEELLTFIGDMLVES